jgi:hypothetical protein
LPEKTAAHQREFCGKTQTQNFRKNYMSSEAKLYTGELLAAFDG